MMLLSALAVNYRRRFVINKLQALASALDAVSPKNAIYVTKPVVNGQQMLWQDAAKTIPVTQTGEPVAVIVDATGGGRDAVAPTDLARGIYHNIGGLDLVRFNGVDTYYLISRTLAESVPGMWMTSAVSFAETGSTQERAVGWFSKGDSPTATRFRLNMINQSYLQCSGRRLDSDGFDGGALSPSGTITFGEIAVFTAYAEYTSATAVVRKNGAEVGRDDAFSTAGISDAAAAQEAYLGRIDANYTAMDFYGAVMQGADDTALPQAEQYLTDLITAPEAPVELPSEINVFLVAGQSNTDGRVAYNDPAAPAYLDDKIVDGIKAWDGTGLIDYNLANSGPNDRGAGWVTNAAENNFSFAHVALHDIAQSMANVVACQVTEGGTAITPSSNARGCWNADYTLIPTDTPALLEALENRYTALATYCTANNIALNVKGIIWHQGESDGDRNVSTADHLSNFSAVVSRMRTFTGVADLPIFFGTFSGTGTKLYNDIRAALEQYAASDANAYCRDNTDLTNFDGVHFDGASSVTFGQWAATTYSSATTVEPVTTLQGLADTYHTTVVDSAIYVPQPTVLGEQSIWQDEAMTVPATVDGDPVRAIRDVTGNGNHGAVATGDAGFVYRTDGTKHWLDCLGKTTCFRLTGLDLAHHRTLFVTALRATSHTPLMHGWRPNNERFYAGSNNVQKGDGARIDLTTETGVDYVIAHHFKTAEATGRYNRTTTADSVDPYVGDLTLTNYLAGSSSPLDQPGVDFGFTGRFYGGSVLNADGIDEAAIADHENYFATLAGVTL